MALEKLRVDELFEKAEDLYEVKLDAKVYNKFDNIVTRDLD